MTISPLWPRLRAVMDAALEAPNGVAVTYASYFEAERDRTGMYQIRQKEREKAIKAFGPEDPRGSCVYDALSFHIHSHLVGEPLHVHFLDSNEIQEIAGTESNLFPGRAVSVTYGKNSVTNAPSFPKAFEILRRDAPADLVLRNGYNLEGLEIRHL